MNKESCEIIRDILPLYIDDACSTESKAFIEEHIKECKECESMLKLMRAEEYVPDIDEVSENENAVAVMKKINKRILKKQILVAAITALVLGGVWAYFFLLETNNPYKNYVSEITNVQDIMYYFKFAFFPYIVLFIVVITNFYKAICFTKRDKNSDRCAFTKVDLAIDVLCGLAMGAGIVFQGVLADNNAPGHMGWSRVLIIISIISLIIFIINLVVVSKKKSNE